MVNGLSLQSFYLNQNSSIDSQPALYQEVLSFLQENPAQLQDAFHLPYFWKFSLSEDYSIQNWQNLLTLNLLATLQNVHSPALSHILHSSLNQPWNHQSQYMRTLIAVNQALVGMPVHHIDLNVLERGAAPIELKEYCPWQSLPYAPYHAELGLLLCLLASITKQDQFQKDALNLATWHLNTLDTNYFPLVGLFSQEKDGSPTQHLMWNYLFLKALFRLTGEKKFKIISDAQIQFLESVSQQWKIVPLMPLLEKWIDTLPLVREYEQLELPSSIYDPATALIGLRYPHYHAICTLHGGYTGLGCLRWKDVSIVNYGPQYLPLGECQGFGIEGNYYSDHGIRQTWIERYANAFTLRGCTRLVDQPIEVLENSIQMGKLHGIWLETEQEFKDKKFSLKTQFLGFDGWNSIAFSFFVKASQCKVLDTNIFYRPKTFERYEGPSKEILLEGKEGAISLVSSCKDNMQIIPLGGGDSFWGADFLIAYTLSNDQRQYDWQLSFKELTI